MSRTSVKGWSLLALGLMLGAGGCRSEGDPLISYTVPPTEPPRIDSVSQSASTVGPGDVLVVSATVSDPAGRPLSISWRASTGILGTPEQAGNASQVRWMALSCLPAGVAPSLQVTVTNNVELTATHTFQVDWSGRTCGGNVSPCLPSLEGNLLTLKGECVTDSTLFIPEGFTLDGAGFPITAVDPAGGAFTGAILRNRGGTMHLRNLRVTTRGLADPGASCPAGADRLRGILFEGASGTVVDSEVWDIYRGSTSTCQEGQGIEVRNDDALLGPFQVDVLRDRVATYHEGGIVASGRVDVTVSDNVVMGGGPVGHIARSGILFGGGATGRLTRNLVFDNAYTGATASGAGIRVIGGALHGTPLCLGLTIEDNTLRDNDVGVLLSQGTTGGGAPATATGIRVANNTMQSNGVTAQYQAGVSDRGTGNTITTNAIFGPGYDPAQQPGVTFGVDVDAGPVAKAVFLTSAQDVAAGACSGRLTVQAQDAAGNLSVPGPARATFDVSATGTAAAGVTFHADPACSGAPLTTLDLGNPHAEGSFYFKATQPGTLTVMVTTNPKPSASQEQTVR